MDKITKYIETQSKKNKMNNKEDVGKTLIKNSPKKQPHLKECTEQDLLTIRDLLDNPSNLNNFEPNDHFGSLLSTKGTKQIFIKKKLKPVCYPKEVKIANKSSGINDPCFKNSHCINDAVCKGSYKDILPGKCVSLDDEVGLMEQYSHSCENSDECPIGASCKETRGILLNEKLCSKTITNIPAPDFKLYGLV